MHRPCFLKLTSMAYIRCLDVYNCHWLVKILDQEHRSLWCIVIVDIVTNCDVVSAGRSSAAFFISGCCAVVSRSRGSKRTLTPPSSIDNRHCLSDLRLGVAGSIECANCLCPGVGKSSIWSSIQSPLLSIVHKRSNNWLLYITVSSTKSIFL